MAADESLGFDKPGRPCLIHPDPRTVGTQGRCSMPQPQPVTALLHAWRAGDEGARDRLMDAVYGELRRLAENSMRGERGVHTLETGGLVHEAFLRLVDADIDWQDRAHFFSLCARTMRRILVDHARSKKRHKRGGDLQRVTLNEGLVAASMPGVLQVDEMLRALARFDARKALLVELHYFGGLTFEEMGEVVGTSKATAHREFRLARAWLARALRSTDEA